MEIKTKFNIGDEVFFLGMSKVCHNRIVRIEVCAEVNWDTKITYKISGFDKLIEECDNLLFATKEDLIASL